MRIKKLVGLLLICICSINVKAQSADDIISKYITFIGGEDHWKSVHTVTNSGTYNYGGIEFPFTSYSKAPNLYKFIVPFNGKYYEQVFNGKTGWKIDAFKNQTKKTLLTGKAALAMANEADVEIENAFINYKSKGDKAIAEGEDTAVGLFCYKIKFIRNSGDTETYFFNKRDFSLIKKTSVSKNEEMENKMLDTYYTDYRNVQGIKIPFKATSKIGNQTILIITINKIELNAAIDDKEFD